MQHYAPVCKTSDRHILAFVLDSLSFSYVLIRSLVKFDAVIIAECIGVPLGSISTLICLCYLVWMSD